jgi:hypothetical protein
MSSPNVPSESLSSVVGELAASLEPARLEELGEGLMDMYWNQQPGVSFVRRREITTGSYSTPICVELGDMVVKLAKAKLRLSDLMDVQWQSSFDNNRQVVVQASPNTTDTRYPSLTVIEGVKPSTIVNGRILPLNDASALSHLCNFKRDLVSTETMVENWWARPSKQASKSTIWRYIEGNWQQISE